LDLLGFVNLGFSLSSDSLELIVELLLLLVESDLSLTIKVFISLPIGFDEVLKFSFLSASFSFEVVLLLLPFSKGFVFGKLDSLES
jgi:hypothetical protein